VAALAVASGTYPRAALGAAPGCRIVLGVVVERPVAFCADFKSGAAPILLRREHDRDQPAFGIAQPRTTVDRRSAVYSSRHALKRIVHDGKVAYVPQMNRLAARLRKYRRVIGRDAVEGTTPSPRCGAG